MTHPTMLVCRNASVAADIRAVLPVSVLVVGELTGHRYETVIVSAGLMDGTLVSESGGGIADWLDWLPTTLVPGGRLIWL
jgi:hypothetical protein